jgi:protein gp37
VNNTSIEWTDSTWNPIRGCSRVSEGCRHCYAEKVAYRFSGPGQPYEGLVRINAAGERQPQWNGQIQFAENHLLDALRWNPIVDHDPTCDYYLADRKQIRNCGCPTRARRIFVNSMSDLFHENVTDVMLDRIFAVMALCPQHTFQVLTKRPERMLAYLSAPGRRSDVMAESGDLAFDVQSLKKYPRSMFPKNAEVVYDLGANGDECGCRVTSAWPLHNVQLGVSVEDQPTADVRIPLLLQTPASVRFISAEPLLGALDIRPYLLADPERPNWSRLNRLHWAIVGGESGPGARPMHPDWARGLRDQCVGAGVPFLFKQWGEWKPISEMPESEYEKLYVSNKKAPEEWEQADYDETHGRRCTVPVGYMNFVGETGLERGFQSIDGHGGMTFFRVGKKAAGRLLDGREWNEMPKAGSPA